LALHWVGSFDHLLAGADMSIRTISPTDAFAGRGAENVSLIDVRTPAEYRALHAEGAVLVPLDQLNAGQFSAQSHGPLYLICASGTRARIAAEKLDAAGLAEPIVIQGGTTAWEAAGLPVVRGKSAISLERQVRITAGSLVVIGVILGWFVSRYFFALSGIVGAGLVFAGITDTCGMGLLLARAPWNQSAGDDSSAASV
jgi:rhodanese-related sulfurtransferase